MRPFLWLVPFVDVYLVLMLVFLVISRLEVASINYVASPRKAAPTNALYLIKVEWPGNSPSDVDTYVSDPDNHLVYFRRLSDGMMILDHDCTGNASNTVTLPSGEVVTTAMNEETVEIRGTSVIPGEYIANVQMYAMRDTTPVKVSVSLYKTSGGDDVKVYDEMVQLSKRGEEKTAFRFTLMKDGDVVDINHMQKRFVGSPGGI